MDKSLALRLGRAAVIQDWDIAIPREYNFEGLMGPEASGVPTEWLKLAILQGQIYEQLFVTPEEPAGIGLLTAMIVTVRAPLHSRNRS